MALSRQRNALPFPAPACFFAPLAMCPGGKLSSSTYTFVRSTHTVVQARTMAGPSMASPFLDLLVLLMPPPAAACRPPPVVGALRGSSGRADARVVGGREEDRLTNTWSWPDLSPSCPLAHTHTSHTNRTTSTDPDKHTGVPRPPTADAVVAPPPRAGPDGPGGPRAGAGLGGVDYFLDYWRDLWGHTGQRDHLSRHQPSREQFDRRPADRRDATTPAHLEQTFVASSKHVACGVMNRRRLCHICIHRLALSFTNQPTQVRAQYDDADLGRQHKIRLLASFGAHMDLTES